MNEQSHFYLIYPLGLTNLGLEELREKWELHFKEIPLIIEAVDEAGILIQTKTLHGFLLNLILKTPTRILLRINEFKARDFPKLFQKVSKTNWKPLLLGIAPEIEASSTNSRLFDSRKIAKAIEDGIAEFYRKQPAKKKYLDIAEKLPKSDLPKIYYRAVDDVITLSIDTTGERLHKRGEKFFSGFAPLRESFAALLIKALLKDIKGESYHLIDPMSGSGTFLIEAKNHFSINNKRDFAFFNFPQWIDDLEAKKTLASLLGQEQKNFSHYTGFDLSNDVIKQAKENSKELGIDFIQADLFAEKMPDFSARAKTLAIINPPYGVRVGDKEKMDVMFFHDVIKAIKTKFNPERIGIIIPDDFKFNPKKDDSLIAKYPFKNGGIPVTFYVLK